MSKGSDMLGCVGAGLLILFWLAWVLGIIALIWAGVGWLSTH